MKSFPEFSSPALVDLSASDVRRYGHAAVEWMADYLSSIREQRVYPETSANAIRNSLERELPADGTNFEQLLGTFRDVIVRFSRHNAHPRMFGYVQAPGIAIGAFADLLASTLNANLTAWRSAPAAVELERLTIDWTRQIIGMDESATGLFLSGGSMANLAGLAAARAAKAPANSPGQKLRIYASEETHHSIIKAAVLLGMGHESVRTIAVDERFRIRTDQLVEAIDVDLRNGYCPLSVVGNAGTVGTGAVDPLTDLGEIAQRFNLWLHVDGSYGGFATLAESARPLFEGIATADSVALDPHKWLYLPVDCGCILYRRPETARAAFAQSAEYTRVMDLQADEAFAFWDYGPELSRRFRALKVWMLLKAVGTRALGELIEHDLNCARHLEKIVQQSNDFEMLAPVELSIFCFRYRRPGLNEAELDAFNERLLVALQRDGSSYLSNARMHGRFALRGCLMNYRTTFRDMEIVLEDLRRLASTL